MAGSSNPKISVIIATRDRALELEKCLKAVQGQTFRDFEVLVVDSAPVGQTAEELAQRYGAGYIRLNVPGMTIARNAGARTASGEILAFTDDDAVPEPKWLQAIAAAFDSLHVGAVTGPIFPLNTDPAIERRWVQAGGTGPGEVVPVTFSRETPGVFRLANSGAIGSGANVSFQRKVFLEVLQGFDERLGVGGTIPAGEEALAFWYLVKRGGQIHFTPEAVVRHPIPLTNEQLIQRYIRGVEQSSCHFALLLFEHPGDFFRVLSLFIAKMTGWQPHWRERFGNSFEGRPLSRLRSFPYWMVGFCLYWKSIAKYWLSGKRKIEIVASSKPAQVSTRTSS